MSAELTAAQVRERVRWARRRGNPAWLWPDTPIEAWRTAQQRIASATTAILAGARGTLEGDAAAIGLACYISGMGPLLGWWQQQGLIEAPDDVAAMLDRHLDHNRRRMTLLETAARASVAMFTQRGVPVVVLKGLHTAFDHFPDPATRPASDVDLLVAQGDAIVAAGMLAAQGFLPAGRGAFESNWRPADGAESPRTLDVLHADDPWSIDLHHSLDLFVSPGSAVARLDLVGPMAGTARWCPDPAAQVLDQPLLLLHLAVHAGSGLQSLTLLRLVELVLVIRKDTPSWEEFIGLADRTGSLGYAWPALETCEKLAPGTIPGWVLARAAAAAPHRARSIVARLTPGDAQRVDRNSLAEHFMWTRGPGGWVRQLGSDLIPASSWSRVREIYAVRSWQMLRGRVSR